MPSPQASLFELYLIVIFLAISARPNYNDTINRRGESCSHKPLYNDSNSL